MYWGSDMTSTAPIKRFTKTGAKFVVGAFILLNLSACAGSSNGEVGNWWYNQRWEGATADEM
jgi:hypothetical protein